MVAGVENGKDEPSAGPQNAHDAAQGWSKVWDVHQRHVTDDAIERAVRHAVEATGVGVAILNPTRRGFLMVTRDCQQPGGEVDADDGRAQVCQMPRHSALAAGEVADAPSGDLAHERLYGRKEGILAHRVRSDPTVVPLGNGVIGTRGHRLPPYTLYPGRPAATQSRVRRVRPACARTRRSRCSIGVSSAGLWLTPPMLVTN